MSSVMRKIVIVISVPALVFWAMAASAHHSAAQYDFTKRVTVVGIVKKFVVMNPHTEAVVTVTDAKGTRDISFEGHSASHFYRAGYKRDMVHVGDKIAVLIAPRKDGADGGYIQAFTDHCKTVGFSGLSPDNSKLGCK